MGEPEIPPGQPIAARGASVVRGGVRVLDRVDLTIAPRSFTFILGPNGSGKSTLLRLLHGLIRPDEGEVTWGGDTTRPLRHAMVFQRPVLLRRSAAGNVRYALGLAGVHGSDAALRAYNALVRVGLSALAHRAARVLSGGEQQRLALARAAALEPDVLFLDEPTASLDPPATRAVEEIVKGIYAGGTTIVMTTHRLAQAKRLADDVIFLDAGRVAECTPAAQFFTVPRSLQGRAFLEGERL